MGRIDTTSAHHGLGAACRRCGSRRPSRLDALLSRDDEGGLPRDGGARAAHHDSAVGDACHTLVHTGIAEIGRHVAPRWVRS